MTKIWGDYGVNQAIESFCKGDDSILDAKLLTYDIAATQAHITMLADLGVLSKSELKSLETELDNLKFACTQTGFCIPPEYEDGHSYLEAMLTKACGEAGKKVHFLRSRNDQSLTMLSLYMKDVLGNMSAQITDIIVVLTQKQQEFLNVPMPGYTHMQKAMPSTVNTWLVSFESAIIDANELLKTVSKIVDQNPLGSGAGFGFIGQKMQPNRQLTTQLLGFAKTQENPMYCGMSRGYFELLVLQSIQPIVMIASQFAADLLLYTTTEFGYFLLPREFTTGSSIMPQKQNYDCLEIMRGKESIYWGYLQQIHGIISIKTSGYQRDLQLTKKPFMEAVTLAHEQINICKLVIENLQINEDKLNKSMTPELYATKKANDKVAAGMNFRDAYLETKKELENNL